MFGNNGFGPAAATAPQHLGAAAATLQTPTGVGFGQAAATGNTN